jgi:hypothetical protein
MDSAWHSNDLNRSAFLKMDADFVADQPDNAGALRDEYKVSNLRHHRWKS